MPWSHVSPETKSEAVTMLRIGAPAAFTSLFRVLIGFTDISFLGHLGTAELAGSSLATVWCVITTACLFRGICSGVNCLCAQAQGAGNLPLMGTWLQIGIFCGSLGSLVILGLWALTPFVVHLMGVSLEIQAYACTFTYISMIWLLPQVTFTTIFNWMEAQQIMIPGLVVAGAFVLVNFGLNWLLIIGIKDVFNGFGFVGSPVATSVTRCLMLAVFVWYCFFFKNYQKGQWQGWSLKILRRKDLLKEYWKQVWPMAASSTFEELQLQVIAVMAAHLSDASLATHSAVLEFFILLSTFLFGLVTSVTVRTGYHLGGGDVESAKRVLRISLVAAICLASVTATLIYLLRNEIGLIFSTDPEVIQLTVELCPLVGAAYVFLSLFYTSIASLQGQGRPRAIAVSFLVGAWVVCMPLAYVFAFKLGYGLLGLWYSLVAGYGTITLMLLYSVWSTKWEEVADAAVKRSTQKIDGKNPLSLNDPESDLQPLIDGAG